MKKLVVFMVLFQFIFASYVIAYEERFIPSDLVVKDREAHRIWIRDASIIGNAMTWNDAFKAVKNLNEQKYAGLQCWRLPEKEELLALSEYTVANAEDKERIKPINRKSRKRYKERSEERDKEINRAGFKDMGLFKNVQLNLYWSATHYTHDDVWVVDMSLGSVSGVSKKGLHYIWPVCDYDKKELEADERQIAEERRRQEQLQAAKENAARQKALAEEKERNRILKLCNNEVLTQGQFLSGKNVYADKGKCVELSASTFQMVSVTEGLFDIGTNQIAYIRFKNTFRGVGVNGIAKIKGMKSYTTRLGYVNEVPYLEMLEIKKIYGVD